MGCGASTATEKINIEEEDAEEAESMIILGGHAFLDGNYISEWSKQIQIYYLKRCKHVRSVPLPRFRTDAGREMCLTHGFSAVKHPTLPTVFISGGCYEDDPVPSQIFWRVDLRTEETILQNAITTYGQEIPVVALERSRRLLDMPLPIKGHKSCYVRLENRDYVYVVGAGDRCIRFDFANYDWDYLPLLPYNVRDIYSLLNIDSKLYVLGDDKLLRYEMHLDNRGQWKALRTEGFPAGNAVVVGGKIYIHSYHYQENALIEYDPSNDSLRKFSDINESDVMIRSGMCSFGNDSIYFTGGFDEVLKQTSTQIVQFCIRKKHALAAAFMTTPSEDHISISCSHNIVCSECNTTKSINSTRGSIARESASIISIGTPSVSVRGSPVSDHLPTPSYGQLLTPNSPTQRTDFPFPYRGAVSLTSQIQTGD